MLWGRARKGEDTEAIREWIKERESWAKRHFRDGQKFKGDTEPNLSNVAGVVAQIKWGVIGNLGERGMKDVILELTKKLEGRKDNMKNVSPTVKQGLENKVKVHNEEVKDLKVSWNPRVTYAKLEKVFDRGVGAYRTNRQSVRPNVRSEEQWAYARTNSFLFVMRKGRFQGGQHDTDLLPKDHPMKKAMDDADNSQHVRKNSRCPDGYEHKMPDGSWMCGRRHGGGGYGSNMDEVVNFLNIMKEEMITEIKLIKKNK
jgi:hypothetical protein